MSSQEKRELADILLIQAIKAIFDDFKTERPEDLEINAGKIKSFIRSSCSDEYMTGMNIGKRLKEYENWGLLKKTRKKSPYHRYRLSDIEECWSKSDVEEVINYAFKKRDSYKKLNKK